MNPAVFKGNLKSLGLIRPMRGKQHLWPDLKTQDLERPRCVEEATIALAVHPLSGEQGGH